MSRILKKIILLQELSKPQTSVFGCRRTSEQVKYSIPTIDYLKMIWDSDWMGATHHARKDAPDKARATEFFLKLSKIAYLAFW